MRLRIVHICAGPSVDNFKCEHNLPMTRQSNKDRELLERQLGRLYIAVLRMRRTIRNELGISQNTASVLEFLRYCHPTPVRASDLAIACGIAPSALTKLLASIERQGFIRKEVSPTDRRVINVHIDSTYLDALDGHLRILTGCVDQILSRVNTSYVAGLSLVVADLIAEVEELVDRALRGRYITGIAAGDRDRPIPRRD